MLDFLSLRLFEGISVPLNFCHHALRLPLVRRFQSHTRITTHYKLNAFIVINNYCYYLLVLLLSLYLFGLLWQCPSWICVGTEYADFTRKLFKFEEIHLLCIDL